MNTYQELFRENFDISDEATRKCIVNLEDGEQEQLLTALSSKLYDMIVAKVDHIDFGTIPKSRGDISKVDGIENTEECLKIIRQLVMEYREDPTCVDTVITAIQNIKDRKGLFVKSFALNVELPMLLYNTTVLAIEQSVSFLIAVCIVYIKDPDIQGMNAALDKAAYNNAMSNLLFEQLTLFNNGCRSKEIDNLIEELIKNGGRIKECGEGYGSDYCPPQAAVQQPNDTASDYYDSLAAGGDVDSSYEPINGSNEEEIEPEDELEEAGLLQELGIAGGIVLGALATPGVIALTIKGIKALFKIVIPFLRNLVYFFISKRDKFAEDLAIQARFIEANAYKLQYSTNSNLDDDEKGKVIQKQLKIAKRLQAMSNKIAVKNKRAEAESKKMAAEDMKKVKIEEIKDDIPAEIYDKSVLF
jgi:hypothetical protein